MEPEPEPLPEFEPDPAPVPEPESEPELNISSISSTARFIQGSRIWCGLCLQWSLYVLCFCCSGSISMEPELEPAPELETDLVPESEPDPVPEPEPDPFPEFEPPAPEFETALSAEFEPDPSPEFEQNPEPEFDPPAPEFETDPWPGFEPDTWPGFEPDPSPEFEENPGPEFEPEFEPDPALEFEPEPVMVFEPPVLEIPPDPWPEVESEPVLEFEPDTSPEPEVELLLVPMPEVESEPGLNSSALFSRFRHKCFACFKQFKRKRHLVDHMWYAYHSVHEPKCPVCLKHCQSFECVRQHLHGPNAKGRCASVFSERGCILCLKIFEVGAILEHKEECCLSATVPLGTAGPGSQANACGPHSESSTGRGRKAVAIDCKMVAAIDWKDDTVDQCARVCVVDEDEKVILDMFVQPKWPVTDYRHEVTGLTEDDSNDAVLLTNVQEKILAILHDSCDVGGRLLIGHGLECYLDCLEIKYPFHLQRDIAEYRPLQQTNSNSRPLKNLAKIYLGYEIQSGQHSPYEDCVAAMRLYKRMRDQDHYLGGMFDAREPRIGLHYWEGKNRKKLSPEELYGISTSKYRCWCLDGVTV